MQESDGKDSLGKLIEDVENAEAEGCCGYFGKRKSDSCTGCPARDVDEPCDAIVYGELARRLHALMPHDMDGRDIREGDTLSRPASWYTYKVCGFAIKPVDGMGFVLGVDPAKCKAIPEDSWEQLERDARKNPSWYVTDRALASHDGGSPDDQALSMAVDIVRRAKKLAGVE